MSSVYVRIEVDLMGSPGNLGKAIAWLRAQDRDFLWPDDPWWYKPSCKNPRGRIARCLSRFGLRGRLSVEPHDGKSEAGVPPTPRWSGFTPSERRSRRFSRPEVSRKET